METHRAAGGGDVAELLGEAEQAQAESDQHVMLCHATLLKTSVGVVTPSPSERPDAPAAAGASDLKTAPSPLRPSQLLGVSPS
jgi:hypothetical protein